MREIKFRAWDKKEKHMLEDVDFTFLLHYLLFQINPNSFAYIAMKDHFSEIEWLQFTGLKDKNGKEIYEGDIVKMPDAKQATWVEYQPPEFVMRHKTKSGNKSESWSTFDLAYTENQFVEIIGNIYENKELLK